MAKVPAKKAKKSSDNTSKKSGSNKIRWIILLMLAVCIVIGFNYLDNNNSQSFLNNLISDKKNENNSDFIDKTKKIHKVVDKVLADYKDGNLEIKEYDKEVSKENANGKILWHNRQIFFKLDDNKFNDFKTKLTKALEKENAQIIESVDDKYEGQNIKRIDVGIKDKLNNDELVIISDKIYLLSTLAQVKEKTKVSPGVKGKLALVIDDFGYNQEGINIYQQIDRPLTFAILPNQTYSKKAVVQAANNQREFILHLPMEASSVDAMAEPKTVNVNMSDSEISSLVNDLLNTVPEIIGVNNHQGSRATTDSRVMRDVLATLKERNLCFIDSKTSASSVAYKLALEMNVPTAENSLFIDNSSDIEAIKKQLRLAAKMAIDNGSIVAIGHARINTGKAIKEMIPELEEKGIKLIYASELLR